MTKQIVGIGAGGHAKGILEILLSQAKYDVVGLLDPRQALHGTQVLGVPVLGGDDQLPDLVDQGVEAFFVGVGGVGDNGPRQRLFEMACALGLEAVNIRHPRAVLSPSAQLGGGVIIMASAVVNADAKLGANVIVNTGAIIEHDCVVGDHVHISTGAQLAGTVTLETGVHIGIGATIRQGIRIGARAVVGAGAVVVKDVPAGVTVVGVPAHEIRPT